MLLSTNKPNLQVQSSSLRFESMGYGLNCKLVPSKIPFQGIRRWLRGIWSRSLLYEIGWAFYTLPHHIRLLHKYRLDPRIDPGPEIHLDANGCPSECLQRLFRTVDRQTLVADMPWVSPVETLLFLEGWDMGADWAFYSECNQNKESWHNQCNENCCRPNRILYRTLTSRPSSTPTYPPC